MIGASGALRAVTLWAAVSLVLPATSGCRGNDRHAETRTTSVPVVIFFGDSITAGHGLDPAESFPSLIDARLERQGIDARVVNAGVSGDTTTAALERLAGQVVLRPALVLVELGANDMFRGFDRRTTFKNLVEIVRSFQEVGARVIVAGVRFPDAHPAYDLSMGRLYEKVADETDAAYIADLLLGVAGNAGLNLADRIHPNAAGQEAIAKTAWPVVEREVLQARR